MLAKLLHEHCRYFIFCYSMKVLSLILKAEQWHLKHYFVLATKGVFSVVPNKGMHLQYLIHRKSFQYFSSF